MIKKFLGAAALLSLSVSATAQQYSVKYGKKTIVYTKTQEGDTTILAGHGERSNSDFLLKVKGRQVIGHVENRPVAFTIAKPLTNGVQVAQR